MIPFTWETYFLISEGQRKFWVSFCASCLLRNFYLINQNSKVAHLGEARPGSLYTFGSLLPLGHWRITTIWVSTGTWQIMGNSDQKKKKNSNHCFCPWIWGLLVPVRQLSLRFCHAIVVTWWWLGTERSWRFLWLHPDGGAETSLTLHGVLGCGFITWQPQDHWACYMAPESSQKECPRRN